MEDRQMTFSIKSLKVMVLASSTVFAFLDYRGLPNDKFVSADYDGDSKTDSAVYRKGVWWLRLSSSGSLSVQNFGNATDMPIASSLVK
jgi:hypothetical protein